MTRLIETRRRRRFRRARIVAAVTGFGMLALSMFGLGIAAQGAPPAQAAAPSIDGPANNSYTSDPTPQVDIAINTDTDQFVTVYADGSPYCTIPSTGIGLFAGSCSGTVGLPDGVHSFTADSDYVATPGFVSTLSAAVSVTIQPADTPSILTPLNNSFSADPAPQIQIFVFTDADSTVNVYADGAPYCTMGPTGVGAYNNSCVGGSPLPLGLHTFTATTAFLTSPGFESPPSSGVNVTIYDDSFPTMNVGSPTIDTTPTFSGTGPIGGTIVQVYVMPAAPVLCTNVPIDAAGNWSCESSVVLAPGPYTVRASSQDLGGGGSFTTVNMSVIAATPPTVDDTFGPGWRSGYAQTPVQGNKDIGAVQVTIEASSDGGTIWNTYCDLHDFSDPPLVKDSSLWFCNNPTGFLVPGDNLIRAFEYDELGNQTAAGPAITITYVNQQPTITTPTPNFVTNDTTPQFEGTLDAGATNATVYEYPGDSTTFCFDPSPIGTDWSCNVLAPLADGTYQFWVSVSPGQGLSVGPQTFTIDTVDPAIPVITDPTSPSSTTNAHPTISGTGEIGSSVNILVDGVPNACFTTANVDPFGNWQCELVTPLALGPHNLQTTATDEAGNVSPLSGVQLVLTIDPAMATIDQTFSPWYTANDFVQVRGTNSDNPVQIWVEVNDNPGPVGWTPYCSADYDAVQPGLTIWFCDELASPGQQGTLQLGDNYLRARVIVDGGQLSPWSTPIFIDRVVAPDITSFGEGAVFTTRTPTFSGTAPLEASFIDVAEAGEVSFPCTNVPVQPDGSWSCQSSVSFADGPHEVYLTTDINVGGGPFNFTIAATPPPFPVIDGPASPTTDTTPTIVGSAQPGTDVTVWVDGEPVSCTTGSFQPDGSGRWGCTIGPLTYGQHQIAASSTDSLGRTAGPSPTQLTLNVTLPPPGLFALVWKLGTFKDSYHPGDSVEITGSGLPVGAEANAEIHSTPQWVGSALTDSTGTFTIDAVVPKDITPGMHTFVVTVTAEGATPSIIEQPVMIEAVPIPKAVAEEIKKNPVSEGDYSDWQSLGDRNDPATPSVMTSSLDTILQILGNPAFIATAGGVGLALLLLVAIPSELLNATISEQYDRLTKRIPRTKASWWSRFKGMLAGNTLIGGIVLTVLASIIFGFADPGFGFDLTSLRIVIACALGLLVVGLVASLITGAIVARKWKLSSVLEIQPLGIILAVVGVIISRFLEFSPGILIGLLLGIALIGKVSKADEGRTAAVKAGVVWALAVLAWAGYSLLIGPLYGTSFAGNLTIETMVAITAEGLTALLIGLLPFKFLEGSALWNHNKFLWAAIWLGAAASWVLIVLPQNFGEIQGSIWVWGAIVGGFALVAITLYLVFRFAVKPEPEEEDESESETQKVRLGRGR